MLIILATSMVPGVALLVPTFYLLDHLGLLNNRFVLVVILASRIAPQTVWFMQNFIDAVPVEIDEAAHMDGASRWQILTKLVLPLIRPGIAAVAVIGAITTWNDYITIAVFAPDTAKRHAAGRAGEPGVRRRRYFMVVHHGVRARCRHCP
jgi:ABC-type glycerol-3-phosphate transport system permease component